MIVANNVKNSGRCIVEIYRSRNAEKPQTNTVEPLNKTMSQSSVFVNLSTKVWSVGVCVLVENTDMFKQPILVHKR
jgi:hypothetical protein